MNRIAHYAPNLWANGGIASYVRRLGRAQAAAGFDVLYFSGDLQPPEPQEADQTVVVTGEPELFDLAREYGVDVLHLHKPVRYLPEDRVTTVRTMHGNQGSCPAGTRYLTRSEKPCKRPYSPSGCLKMHLVERCGSLRYAKVKRNFGGILNEHRLGERLHTFTVSSFLKAWMVRTGYREERLHVLNSPAPEASGRLKPPPVQRIPRFLFMGRLVPQKGPQWLLRAMLHIKQPIRIDLAGDGPMREELESFTARHGLAKKVKFHGWVDQRKARLLMDEARAVIVPSIWQEPAGLVTLEAAAVGRAVIASRVGGIPEYALDEFALLVSPNNTRQMADAIEKLASDYDRAKHMGECGREAAQTQFAMASFLEKQQALYRLAIEGSVPPVDAPQPVLDH
jgi:glycosyltransferase involved in cell wall biosynthesis